MGFELHSLGKNLCNPAKCKYGANAACQPSLTSWHNTPGSLCTGGTYATCPCGVILCFILNKRSSGLCCVRVGSLEANAWGFCSFPTLLRGSLKLFLRARSTPVTGPDTLYLEQDPSKVLGSGWMNEWAKEWMHNAKWTSTQFQETICYLKLSFLVLKKNLTSKISFSSSPRILT
jgi:hypothetical protein